VNGIFIAVAPFSASFGLYITDKNWGMWILRYSGPDQPAPTDR
jgi:hypothetical protein